MRIGITRLHLDDSPKRCERFIDVAAALLDDTERALCVHEARVEVYGRGKFPQRAVLISFVAQRSSEIKMRLRVSRGKLRGLFEMRDRLV